MYTLGLNTNIYLSNLTQGGKYLEERCHELIIENILFNSDLVYTKGLEKAHILSVTSVRIVNAEDAYPMISHPMQKSKTPSTAKSTSKIVLLTMPYTYTKK